MESIKDSFFTIRVLDDLSHKDTTIHEIHPISKFIVTMSFIILVLSFDKYEVNQLLPYIIYPMVLIVLGDIPVTVLLKRMFIGMVFAVCVGIFNPLLDQSIRYEILGIPIFGGWISFASLLIKSGLTILAALLLFVTTGVNQLTLILATLRVPNIFIQQFVLTFRYIDLLIEEVSKTYHAYTLRAPGQKGIHFRVWGSLCGQIIMGTFYRAERIYEAMILRGFTGEFHIGQMRKPVFKDILFIIVWVTVFIIFKYIDIPAGLEQLIGGVR